MTIFVTESPIESNRTKMHVELDVPTLVISHLLAKNLKILSNAHAPNSVTSRKWTPLFEWYVIWYGSKQQKPKKKMHGLKGLELRA